MEAIQTNGNSKWVMWALGIMLTIGIASQAGQIAYTNLKFSDHTDRPHAGSVSRDEFNNVREDVQRLEDKVDYQTKLIIKLQTLIENGGILKNG